MSQNVKTGMFDIGSNTSFPHSIGLIGLLPFVAIQCQHQIVGISAFGD